MGSKFTVVITDLDMMKEVFVKQFENFADRGSFAVSFEVTEGVHADDWLSQQKMYHYINYPLHILFADFCSSFGRGKWIPSWAIFISW